MAVQSSLNYLTRRIGRAIRSFAEQQGWSPPEYAIAGTLDTETERFYLSVGSDRPLDKQIWHSGIMTQLRREFAETPGITSRIVLVVRHVKDRDQIYRDLIVGHEEIDITELL